MPRSVSTRSSKVSPWPLPQRVRAKTLVIRGFSGKPAGLTSAGRHAPAINKINEFQWGHVDHHPLAGFLEQTTRSPEAGTDRGDMSVDVTAVSLEIEGRGLQCDERSRTPHPTRRKVD